MSPYRGANAIPLAFILYSLLSVLYSPSPMPSILIVDDEPAICWSFREALSDEGHEVRVAASAEEALRLASDGCRPDAVVMDVRLPGMDGLSAMSALRERIGSTPVVVMTAFGSLGTAARAMAAR